MFFFKKIFEALGFGAATCGTTVCQRWIFFWGIVKGQCYIVQNIREIGLQTQKIIEELE